VGAAGSWLPGAVVWQPRTAAAGGRPQAGLEDVEEETDSNVLFGLLTLLMLSIELEDKESREEGERQEIRNGLAKCTSGRTDVAGTSTAWLLSRSGADMSRDDVVSRPKRLNLSTKQLNFVEKWVAGDLDIVDLEPASRPLESKDSFESGVVPQGRP
jgi:hypothetical protein